MVHQGYDASKFCHDNFMEFMKRKYRENKNFFGIDEEIKKAFIEFDKMYLDFFNNELIKMVKYDDDCDVEYSSGTTASVFFIIENGNEIEVINMYLGDSAYAVSGFDDDIPYDEKIPHKPSSLEERKRYEHIGGKIEKRRADYITADDSSILMQMTRAIGDFELKQRNNLPQDKQIVIAVPRIRRYKYYKKGDNIKLLLCTDGCIRLKGNIDREYFTSRTDARFYKGVVSEYCFLQIDNIITGDYENEITLRNKYMNAVVPEDEIIYIGPEEVLSKYKLGEITRRVAYCNYMKNETMIDYCDDTTIILISHSAEISQDLNGMKIHEVIEDRTNYDLESKKEEIYTSRVSKKSLLKLLFHGWKYQETDGVSGFIIGRITSCNKLIVNDIFPILHSEKDSKKLSDESFVLINKSLVPEHQKIIGYYSSGDQDGPNDMDKYIGDRIISECKSNMCFIWKLDHSSFKNQNDLKLCNHIMTEYQKVGEEWKINTDLSRIYSCDQSNIQKGIVESDISKLNDFFDFQDAKNKDLDITKLSKLNKGYDNIRCDNYNSSGGYNNNNYNNRRSGGYENRGYIKRDNRGGGDNYRENRKRRAEREPFNECEPYQKKRRTNDYQSSNDQGNFIQPQQQIMIQGSIPLTQQELFQHPLLQITPEQQQLFQLSLF